MPGKNGAIKELEDRFSSPFVGITFLHGLNEVDAEHRCLRFCEFVNETMKDGKTRYLKVDSLKCLGSRWAFGLVSPNEENLSKFAYNLVNEGRFKSEEQARSEISSSPKLDEATSMVMISVDEHEHDLLLSYMNPRDCMELMLLYQNVTGKRPMMDDMGVMPVCGQCSVKARRHGRMSVSLGCRDSRMYGGIATDRLVVGIPWNDALKIADNIRMNDKEESK